MLYICINLFYEKNIINGGVVLTLATMSCENMQVLDSAQENQEHEEHYSHGYAAKDVGDGPSIVDPNNAATKILISDSAVATVDKQGIQKYNIPNTQISTLPIKLVQTMLYFESESVFRRVANQLKYQSEKGLEKFENELVYNSLRKHHYSMMQNPLIDDIEYSDQNRFFPEDIESILNTDHAVRIGNLVYALNIVSKTVMVYDVVAKTIDIQPIITSSTVLNDGCNFGRKQHNNFNFASNRKVRACKSNYSTTFATGVYMQAEYLVLNSYRNWKRQEVPSISVYLDQWNFIKFYVGNFGPFERSDVLATDKNATHVRYYFDHNTGTYTPDICVFEFGRTHNWTYDFNLDAHGANW